MASLSQGRTAAVQCGLFTHKSVPVIFEPPCSFKELPEFGGRVTRIVTVNKELYIYIFRRLRDVVRRKSPRKTENQQSVSTSRQ